jgi:2-octaprenyl-6-methoxyphenol hydroxylase
MANESTGNGADTGIGTAPGYGSGAKAPACGDLLIAGGGYVGLCVALAVKTAAPHMGVTVVDLAPADAAMTDTRASAIAAAATRMLGQLGVWQELAADAQPINEMIVTDSRLNDAVRPVFLTFADEPAASGAAGQPFAHMIANRDLVTVLRRRCMEEGVELLNNDRVAAFANHEASMHVTLGSGKTREVKLLVAADGVRSQLRELAGIRTVHWPYGQSGIVVTVKHEREHQGRAEEHFLPAGPFAILPLKGNRSSLVWTERTDDAKRLLEADEFTFGLELERRFGHRLGEISVEGKPRAYPLGLTLARDYVRPRFALAGDAAHGIHPIAGQGLNLGFKDAAALAQTIVEAHRLGLDIGSLAVLEDYERWRRFDTVRMGVVTDVLNRLFSNDNPLVRAARSFGLGLVDRMPGLKKQFINQAAGREGGSPRLLQGEAI